MNRCHSLLIGALLLALCSTFWPAREALCAQPAPTSKKARRAAKPAPPVQEQPKLSAEELQAPYSALNPVGADQQNATRVLFDPAPTARPFAAPDPALKLRIDRERVLDPFTGQELTPRPDAAGAKESLKNRDLKGAVDKVGGKAEVQVDLLRF